jgi:hypothetical protein
MNDAAQTQCIRISPTTLLIAVPDGRCWGMEVGSSSVTALPVSPVAAERAGLAASLVEGAISAGLAPTGSASSSRSYTLPRYIRWLAGNYVFAGQTPGLFRHGAQRFEASGRRDLADFARQKAAEEDGHAGLAFQDLQALGLPAAEVIRLVEPPSARVFVERFRAHVESGTPIALFGFSYCLERMAVGRDEAFVRAIQALCPPQCRAYRFLKVHSDTGSDRAHVHEQLAFFEALPGAELEVIACAAYDTAVLLARQPLMDQALFDEEIERRLRLEGIEIPDRSTGEDQRELAV